MHCQITLGKRKTCQQLLLWLLILCLISTSHVVRQMGKHLRDFIEWSLLPQLMPFDGTNPRSMILDNASIHHCDGIMKLIESTGALVIFLPPYSPDHRGNICINQIIHEDAIQSDKDLQEVMMYAFASITAEGCQSWFKDCGYR